MDKNDYREIIEMWGDDYKEITVSGEKSFCIYREEEFNEILSVLEDDKTFYLKNHKSVNIHILSDYECLRLKCDYLMKSLNIFLYNNNVKNIYISGRKIEDINISGYGVINSLEIKNSPKFKMTPEWISDDTRIINFKQNSGVSDMFHLQKVEHIKCNKLMWSKFCKPPSNITFLNHYAVDSYIYNISLMLYLYIKGHLRLFELYTFFSVNIIGYLTILSVGAFLFFLITVFKSIISIAVFGCFATIMFFSTLFFIIGIIERIK